MTSGEGIAPEVESILAAAKSSDPPENVVAVSPRSFTNAIREAEADGRVPIIAEVKPTSPTTNGHRDTDPVRLAELMVSGGAAAVSVLTEATHFGGSPEALQRIRSAVDVPVLRKDFILEEHQLDVVEADLILLIARFVEDLPYLVTTAEDRGFQVLVEVHTRRELQSAVDAGATYIGINNRDLAMLEVELATFESVAPAAPEDIVLVAESGISSPRDVRRMRAAGADALLIGTAIMDGDVKENTNRLVYAE